MRNKNSKIKIKTSIREAANCVIIPHKNPDGDALGSSLALNHFLSNKGLNSLVISPSEYPDFLKWMPGENQIMNYDKEKESSNLKIQKSCEKTIHKCLEETEMPGFYFTLDEIAKKIKTSPPKLEKVILNLKQNGFTSSVTAFNPTGFRTNANINEIIRIFNLSSETHTNTV